MIEDKNKDLTHEDEGLLDIEIPEGTEQNFGDELEEQEENFSEIERALYDDEDIISKKKTESGSLMMSIIGAFLGMIVGMIPYVIVTVLFKQLVASLIFFSLIPIGICFGIILFRGKKKIRSLVLIIIFSVIGMYLSVLLYEAAIIATAYGMPFYTIPVVFILILGTAEIYPIIASDSLYAVIFVALGVFVSWEILRYRAKKEAGEELGEEAEKEIEADIHASKISDDAEELETSVDEPDAEMLDELDAEEIDTPDADEIEKPVADELFEESSVVEVESELDGEGFVE